MKNDNSTSPKNLMKVIRKMGQIEKKVACLYYFENLGVDDIAKILNKNEKYVNGLLERFMMKVSLKFSKTQSVSKGMLRHSK